jgi:hypothetical protein
MIERLTRDCIANTINLLPARESIWVSHLIDREASFLKGLW